MVASNEAPFGTVNPFCNRISFPPCCSVFYKYKSGNFAQTALRKMHSTGIERVMWIFHPSPFSLQEDVPDLPGAAFRTRPALRLHAHDGLRARR